MTQKDKFYNIDELYNVANSEIDIFKKTKGENIISTIPKKYLVPHGLL